MNDNFGNPGDIVFDDGVVRTYDGYYGSTNGTYETSNSRNYGLCVGFAPGTVLTQLATTSPGTNRAYARLLVHNATTSSQSAQNTANDPNPVNRLIYVNTTPPAGGGAVELVIPSGGWVMYGLQWPEASRANPSTNAILFRQGGAEVPRLTVYRQDGTNGDPNFDPVYPFKMRGALDAFGNVITGPNVSNLTYAIDVPVVTNAVFDILVRSDASSVNTLVKLDGGIDLNSQMGLGPLSGGVGPNGPDLRDNKPGYASDVFLGYEQTAFQFRNGPEKFAARNSASNNIVSLGAETYYYTVGGSDTVVPGAGYGAGITNQTAAWVLHDPTNIVTSLSSNPPSQMFPLNPASGQSVDIWVQVAYQLQINTCFIYYTTDGSNPEGAFGIGKGTTQVAEGFWINHDSIQGNLDWWKGTIPGQIAGTQVRYKVALFNGGSANQGSSIPTIFNSEPSGSKLYGLTQAAITNFNPTTAVVWLHNDLNTNNTAIGLQSGFHIVRARTFLPRTNQSACTNTFLQTFYYDGALPGGVIATPSADGAGVSNATYTVVVRTDSTVVGSGLQHPGQQREQRRRRDRPAQRQRPDQRRPGVRQRRGRIPRSEPQRAVSQLPAGISHHLRVRSQQRSGHDHGAAEGIRDDRLSESHHDTDALGEHRGADPGRVDLQSRSRRHHPDDGGRQQPPDPDLLHLDAGHQQHQPVQRVHQRGVPTAPRPEHLAAVLLHHGHGMRRRTMLTYNWTP